MADNPAPMQQIQALRAAAATGRVEVLQGALDDMSPNLARVGQAILAADRGAWALVLELLDGVTNVPGALDGLVSLAITRALVEVGRLDLAEHTANQRLQRAPDDLDIRVARAKAWSRAGLWKEADAEYRAVLGIAPSHPSAILGHGELALSQGDLAAAANRLQQACVAAPLASEPVVALARLFLVAGRPADGARQVASLVQAVPRWEDPRLLSALAELYIASEQIGEAEPLLVRLQAQPQLEDEQIIELARLWAETGRAEPLRGLVNGNTKPGLAALLYAVAARLDGEDPLPGLEEAALTLPEHWWVHEQRAQAMLNAGDIDGAAVAAALAARLAPRAAATRVTAAVIRLRQHDDPQARRLLRVAATHAGLWPSVRKEAQNALAAA